MINKIVYILIVFLLSHVNQTFGESKERGKDGYSIRGTVSDIIETTPLNNSPMSQLSSAILKITSSFSYVSYVTDRIIESKASKKTFPNKNFTQNSKTQSSITPVENSFEIDNFPSVDTKNLKIEKSLMSSSQIFVHFTEISSLSGRKLGRNSISSQVSHSAINLITTSEFTTSSMSTKSFSEFNIAPTSVLNFRIPTLAGNIETSLFSYNIFTHHSKSIRWNTTNLASVPSIYDKRYSLISAPNLTFIDSSIEKFRDISSMPTTKESNIATDGIFSLFATSKQPLTPAKDHIKTVTHSEVHSELTSMIESKLVSFLEPVSLSVFSRYTDSSAFKTKVYFMLLESLQTSFIDYRPSVSFYSHVSTLISEQVFRTIIQTQNYENVSRTPYETNSSFILTLSNQSLNIVEDHQTITLLPNISSAVSQDTLLTTSLHSTDDKTLSVIYDLFSDTTNISHVFETVTKQTPPIETSEIEIVTELKSLTFIKRNQSTFSLPDTPINTTDVIPSTVLLFSNKTLNSTEFDIYSSRDFLLSAFKSIIYKIENTSQEFNSVKILLNTFAFTSLGTSKYAESLSMFLPKQTITSNFESQTNSVKPRTEIYKNATTTHMSLLKETVLSTAPLSKITAKISPSKTFFKSSVLDQTRLHIYSSTIIEVNDSLLTDQNLSFYITPPFTGSGMMLSTDTVTKTSQIYFRPSLSFKSQSSKSYAINSSVNILPASSHSYLPMNTSHIEKTILTDYEYSRDSIKSPTEETLRDSIISSIDESLRDSVIKPTDEALRDSITSSKANPLRDFVTSPIDETIRASMTSSIVEPLRDSVSSPMDEAIRVFMTSSIVEPLRDSVSSPMDETIRVSMTSSIVEPLLDSVTSPIDETLRDSMISSIVEPLRDSVTSPIDETLRDSMISSIVEPLRDSVSSPINETIRVSMGSLIVEPLRDSVTSPMDEAIRVSMTSSIVEPLRDSVSSPIDEAIRVSMTSSIVEPLRDSVTSPIDETLRDSMISSIVEPLRDSVSSPINETIRVSMGSSIVKPLRDSVTSLIDETLRDSMTSSIVEPLRDSVTSPIDETLRDSMTSSIVVPLLDIVTSPIEGTLRDSITHQISTIMATTTTQIPTLKPLDRDYIVTLVISVVDTIDVSKTSFAGDLKTRLESVFEEAYSRMDGRSRRRKRMANYNISIRIIKVSRQGDTRTVVVEYALQKDGNFIKRETATVLLNQLNEMELAAKLGHPVIFPSTVITPTTLSSTEAVLTDQHLWVPGIVLGSIAIVICLIILGIFICLKLRSNRRKSTFKPPDSIPLSIYKDDRAMTSHSDNNHFPVPTPKPSNTTSVQTQEEYIHESSTFPINKLRLDDVGRDDVSDMTSRSDEHPAVQSENASDVDTKKQTLDKVSQCAIAIPEYSALIPILQDYSFKNELLIRKTVERFVNKSVLRDKCTYSKDVELSSPSRVVKVSTTETLPCNDTINQSAIDGQNQSTIKQSASEDNNRSNIADNSSIISDDELDINCSLYSDKSGDERGSLTSSRDINSCMDEILESSIDHGDSGLPADKRRSLDDIRSPIGRRSLSPLKQTPPPKSAWMPETPNKPDTKKPAFEQNEISIHEFPLSNCLPIDGSYFQRNKRRIKFENEYDVVNSLKPGVSPEPLIKSIRNELQTWRHKGSDSIC